MRALLLNSAYQGLGFISWKRAIKLIVKGRADLVSTWDQDIGYGSGSMKYPAVVRLNKYIPRHIKKRRYNRVGVFRRDKYTCLYCLDPNHRILTLNFKWMPLGDLQVGDSLIGFDEDLNSSLRREYKESIVESHFFDHDELFEVKLEDGTIFKVTKEHQWLVRPKGKAYKWCSTLNIQDKLIPRLFDVWDTDYSRDAGWLSGIFDGEGWVRNNRCLAVGVAQNPGFVLNNIINILKNYGFAFSLTSVSGDCKRVCIKGNCRQKLKLLGTIRPERLIANITPEHLGVIRADEYLKVTSVKSIGRGPIVKMKTSTGTFIADGFPHHNCGYKGTHKDLTIDHVVPRDHGGQTTWQNCATSCYDCNNVKSNRTPKQAGMRLSRKPFVPSQTIWHEYNLLGNKHPDWKMYVEGFQSNDGF